VNADLLVSDTGQAGDADLDAGHHFAVRLAGADRHIQDHRVRAGDDLMPLPQAQLGRIADDHLFDGRRRLVEERPASGGRCSHLVTHPKRVIMDNPPFEMRRESRGSGEASDSPLPWA